MGQSWEAIPAHTNVIGPLHSLAFSIQSNRGVYAVLIGSGVSKTAGIPTGWDVTLDLVGKLAAVRKEAPEPDPESWFRNRFGIDPDYSDLLDQLAKTQAERQQLLRGYWEPRKRNARNARRSRPRHTTPSQSSRREASSRSSSRPTSTSSWSGRCPLRESKRPS